MNLSTKKTFKVGVKGLERIGEVGDVMGCRNRLTGGYMGVYVWFVHLLYSYVLEY